MYITKVSCMCVCVVVVVFVVIIMMMIIIIFTSYFHYHHHHPPLLPPPLSPNRWVAPWGPSISLIRWATQALVINDFEDNYTYFPMIPPDGPLGNIYLNTYHAFLHMFGWGGKTKWYCLGMIVVMFVVFKCLCGIILYNSVRKYAKNSLFKS